MVLSFAYWSLRRVLELVALTSSRCQRRSVVGVKGHGIPVKIVFTLTDLTTSTVIDSSTQLSGHGHGHPHQATTECTGVVFNGAASDFFGAHLPPGVAPTDTVEASIDAFVIIKR